MQIFLNGGNFGGLGITVPDSTLNILVQSGADEFWNYDTQIHPQTKTADFVGTATSESLVFAQASTVKLDMQDSPLG